MRRLLIVALLLVGFCAQAQEANLKQLPARVELHPFQSLTLSDEQFLKGDSNGKPVTLAGELRVAQGSGRLPVVVLIHGSSGVGPNVDEWSRELNAMGISTFVLDGFTGRGLTSTSTNQAQLGRLNLILDSYRALELLAKHPRVDPERIAVMGFSRGGQAALYASLKRFHRQWNKSGVDFAAYLPFYPDCNTSYQGETELDQPIRIFHGSADDYDPVGVCKVYVGRLREAGRDATLTEYAGAHHAFDVPLLGTTPMVAKNAQTVRNCVIREEGEGRLVNAATKESFTYQDACVELDPHVGRDPAATKSAQQAVKDFLRTLFKLN